MHGDSGQADTPEASEPARETDCVMRGTCEGPPLFTLFTHAGILPDVSLPLGRPGVATPDLRLAVSAVLRTEPPDLRPPRLTSPSVTS